MFEEEIVGFENSDTLNEIALIDKLDYDCLVRVFDYLPVEDKLKVGQGMIAYFSIQITIEFELIII